MDQDASQNNRAQGESLQPGAGTVVAGIYTLREPLASGGMAEVWLADVDLGRFDYTTLYAYTQAVGTTHVERRKRADSLVRNLRAHNLDTEAVRSVLMSSGVPIPAEQVAVKIAFDGSQPARFEAEWKNMICLNHPNVVQVYGGGAHGDLPYYVMELLTDIVPTRQLVSEFALAAKLHVILQTSRGISYLHDNGVIHRDVKPGNIVTCSTGTTRYVTKVMDLGLAKCPADELSLSTAGEFMGTLSYMAPELVTGDPEPDHRADVYSIGATLYEFVTGKRPFSELKTTHEILMAVAGREFPTPPQFHVPDLPDSVAAVIRCAMAPDPAARYASTTEMTRDLARCLAGTLPTLVPEPPRAPALAEPTKVYVRGENGHGPMRGTP